MIIRLKIFNDDISLLMLIILNKQRKFKKNIHIFSSIFMKEGYFSQWRSYLWKYIEKFYIVKRFLSLFEILKESWKKCSIFKWIQLIQWNKRILRKDNPSLIKDGIVVRRKIKRDLRVKINIVDLWTNSTKLSTKNIVNNLNLMSSCSWSKIR